MHDFAPRRWPGGEGEARSRPGRVSVPSPSRPRRIMASRRFSIGGALAGGGATLAAYPAPMGRTREKAVRAVLPGVKDPQPLAGNVRAGALQSTPPGELATQIPSV